MEFVELERDGALTVLRADRPPANAIDPVLLNEVREALEAVAADPPGALVVQGRPGFFSAGADLKVVPTLDAEGQREMVRGLNAVFLSAYSLPCPVVAAITGHAIAGGFIFALCADQRIASREGSYGITEVKVGLPYPVAAMEIVDTELGTATARSLALSSRLVDASWCERHGVFDEVVEPDAVVPRAMELARELAAQPARAYRMTKEHLRAETIARIKRDAPSDPLLGSWAG